MSILIYVYTVFHMRYLQDPSHTRFGYIGENLFISTGLPFNANLLDHAVQAWDHEKTVYNYFKDSCKKGNICGHYTQV